jgi:hypothetical protein
MDRSRCPPWSGPHLEPMEASARSQDAGQRKLRKERGAEATDNCSHGKPLSPADSKSNCPPILSSRWKQPKHRLPIWPVLTNSRQDSLPARVSRKIRVYWYRSEDLQSDLQSLKKMSL